MKKGNYTPEKIQEEEQKKEFKEFISFEQKTKLKEMFRVMDFFNSYEDKEFNILEFQNKTETKKIYDNIKKITDDELIIIENKSGFIDLKKYVDNSEQIKHYLGVNDKNIVKISKHENNSIIIDIFDRFPKNIEFNEKYLRKGEIFFGIDEKGKEIYVPIKSISNMGISGAAGAGKSVFQRQLINGLIYNLDLKDENGNDYISKIFLVDYKQVSYSQYKYIHPKIKVATNNEELFILNKEVYEENKKRQNKIVEFNKNNPEKEDIDKLETDAIFYIWDEFAEYKDNLPDSNIDKEGNKNHRQSTTDLMSIVQTGRSQNIKTVICSQSLKTDVVDARIRSNLQSRFLLKSKDKESIVACLGGLEPIEELGNINPIKFDYGRMVMLLDTPKGVETLYLQSIFTSANYYKTIMKEKGWKRLTDEDLKSSKSINLSKNDEDDLNDTEDEEVNNLSPEPIKTTIKDNITHEDNVNLRAALWKQSETIEDKDTKSLIRSRLTKINSIIKTENYDLDKINNDLKVVEKII